MLLKLTALLLAVVMLFAACGVPGAETTVPDTQPPDATQPQEPLEVATLEITAEGVLSSGIESCRYGEGEESLAVSEKDGSPCWMLGNEIGNAGAPLYLILLFQEAFLGNATGGLQIDVEYYDGSSGYFEACYCNDSDNVTTNPPAHTGVIECGNTGEWKTASLLIEDMSTTYRGTDYHIRLGSYTWSKGITPSPVYIRKLTFTHIAPPVLEVALEESRTGLIFCNEEIPEMTLKLANISGEEQSVSISAAVKDNYGNTLVELQEELQIPAGQDGSFAPDLCSAEKFGTYTLDVSVTDSEGVVLHQGLYPFSRVLSDGEPLEMIGACTHFMQGKGDYLKNMPIAEQAGVTYWRDDFHWSNVETEKGSLVIPAQWDTWVDYSLSIGMKPMPILNYGNSNYGTVDPTNQEWLDGYVRYCETVVEHFKGRIEVYEIWNEWNIGLGDVPVEYRGAEYYAKVLYQAAKAIRAIDPEVTILAGGYAGKDTVWIGKVLNYVDPDSGEAVYDLIDGVSYHPYVYPNDPESGALVKGAMDMQGLFDGREDKEIWITEIGWPTHIGQESVKEETSAAYLVRMYTAFMAHPDVVDRVFWYDLQNDGTDLSDKENNFGLIRTWAGENVPWSAKANYAALSAMSAKLSGAGYVGEVDLGSGVTAYRFEKEGQDVVVAWARATWVVALEVGEQPVTCSDLYGNAIQLLTVDGTVTLGMSDEPVYLEGDLDEIQVTESPVTVDKKKYMALSGSDTVVSVTRTGGAAAMSGSYVLTMPAGWTAEGLEFAAGDGSVTDEIVVHVPEDAREKQYLLRLESVTPEGVLSSIMLTFEGYN